MLLEVDGLEAAYFPTAGIPAAEAIPPFGLMTRRSASAAWVSSRPRMARIGTTLVPPSCARHSRWGRWFRSSLVRALPGHVHAECCDARANRAPDFPARCSRSGPWESSHQDSARSCPFSYPRPGRFVTRKPTRAKMELHRSRMASSGTVLCSA